MLLTRCRMSWRNTFKSIVRVRCRFRNSNIQAVLAVARAWTRVRHFRLWSLSIGISLEFGVYQRPSWTLCAPVLFIGSDDPLHQRMAHHIALGEFHDGDSFNLPERFV